MGVVVPREKKPPLLVRVLFFMKRFRIGSPRQRLKLFLDLEWTFRRFSEEESVNVLHGLDHPYIGNTRRFVLPKIRSDFIVLDVGCANGSFSVFLAENAAHVIGIDISAEDISLCNNLTSNRRVEFEVADVHVYLENTSQRFDLIFLCHILEHLDDPIQLLISAHEKCRYLYVEVPDFSRCVTNDYRKVIGTELVYSDDDHRFEFDREELIELLDQSGFLIEDHEYRNGVMRFWCSASSDTTAS